MANRLGYGETTGGEGFWYVVLNICTLGGWYIHKACIKVALSEYSLCKTTGGERFWYVMANIAFGYGYFIKVLAKKALSEVRHPERPAVEIPAEFNV